MRLHDGSSGTFSRPTAGRLPPWTQSIRFRLSLTYAATVFAVGSVLLGGLYAWQVKRLEDNEVLTVQRYGLTVRDADRGMDQVFVVRREDIAAAYLQVLEHDAERAAIEQLKRASLVGLGVLGIVAFVAGYVLSGLALRPIDRMTVVARNISGSNLSRRIALAGPDDELKRLGDTFDAMLDRVQAAFEGQRRFVQDTSHELRNPLAAARTNLELALTDDGATADDFRRAAVIAHRSTERMSGLVDDLLEQARTGVPEIEVGPVDLAEVVRVVAADYRAPSRQRGLTISTDLIAVDTTAPEATVVRGDSDALVRAVSNLVSNAVRLAPGGSTISLVVTVDEGCVAVSVGDEGPGLSRADQASAFRRYWRGDNAGPGTGLGLSIVKQIAERHGGTVTVASEPRQGSTFTLTLPAQCAEQGQMMVGP